MNETERTIAPIIAALAVLHETTSEGHGEISRNIDIKKKEYKITLKNGNLTLYRVSKEEKELIPLIVACNGLNKFSEAIDVIARRIDLDT